MTPLHAALPAGAGPHPVIGMLVPWRDVGTGFDEFVTPTVRGLAAVYGERIDLLAIDAEEPGRGDGGRFLAACCAAYRTVAVWEVWNPVLRAMLERRGFRAVTEWRGGVVHGMRWDRPTAASRAPERGERT